MYAVIPCFALHCKQMLSNFYDFCNLSKLDKYQQIFITLSNESSVYLKSKFISDLSIFVAVTVYHKVLSLQDLYHTYI